MLKTRKPVTLEQTFRTGKQALITSTPHFDSSGEITMIITVVRDMTEIYGLQRKYQESEERRRSEMEFLQRNQRFVSRMVAADPRTLEVLARAQKVAALDTTIPVSYTHLDVYKRQTPGWAPAPRPRWPGSGGTMWCSRR